VYYDDFDIDKFIAKAKAKEYYELIRSCEEGKPQ